MISDFGSRRRTHPSSVGSRRPDLWVSVGQMPNIALGPERSRSITGLCDVSSYTLCEDIVFEESDSLRGETSTDEEKNGCRGDKEPVKGCRRSSSINQVSDETTSDETNDNGNWNGSRRDTKGYLMFSC